jgi:single-strand DNA-binding protein
MSKDLNKVMITGRLGADPEMRYTAQGTPVTTFRVASGRSWKDSDGTTHAATEWFRVVVWNKLAEVCNEYLNKGSRVYIEGRLQTRKWIGENGQDRYTTEVIASDVIMLDSRKSADAGTDAEAAEQPEPMAAARRAATAPAPQSAEPAKRKANARRTSAPRDRAGAFEEENLPF